MTISPDAIEELLRETLERLRRQEQRTAALEAALLDSPPTVLALPPHPLTQTPTSWAAETVAAPRPRRESGDDCAPRPAPAPAAAAVSPHAVLASLDDVVWSVSPDGQLVFFAAGAVERLYGVTVHELLDSPGRWLDALPAADRERMRTALARLPDADVFALEHRVAHPAGGDRWAVTRGKLVRDRDGRPLRVDGATTDVTRRARARTAVLDALEGVGAATGSAFLAKLTQHLCAACDCRAAVVVEPHPLDPGAARAAAVWGDGHSAEPFALPAAGLVRDLLSGGGAHLPAGARERHPADPLLVKLRAEAFAAEPLTDGTGRVLGFLAVADDRPFGADSDVRVVLKALAPRAAVELARGDDPAGGSDLEARRAAAERRAQAAESALRSSANLATAGRMAAGIAHDFQNLLGVIVGNADLIREALPDGHAHRETADMIAQTAQTVAGVSRQLLAVSKPGSSHGVPLDAATALRALEPVLRRLVGAPVPLVLDLAPDLPLILSDATQFDRMVLNLVLNARDATARGTITVRATTADIEPGRQGWPRDRPTGRYVAITVADTGCGIPEEVRAKMFELFFTTKGERGTGLGLAMVHEAVTVAGGHIEVESEIGWGTQVRVYWPPLADKKTN